MSWTLSRFRAGDLVEVRSKEEILATLDERGCVERMPFMPEMLKYCAKRFRVSAVAHKTCDTVHKTGGRRLQTTVHLAGLRCDGSAHGGCQADCNLFWRDEWLKPAGGAAGDATSPNAPSAGCSDEQFLASVRRLGGAAGEEPRYSCQATALHDATKLLRWWDLRQYVYDARTGNHSLGRTLRVLSLGMFRRLLRTPVGYRLMKLVNDVAHRLLTGRPTPDIHGKVGPGSPTPTGQLTLKPGDRVRIKSQAEIEKTVDKHGKNRGLSFDPEMVPFCGKVVTVRGCVSQILDERTGKMVQMKQPCIILEGIVCNAEYSQCRLMCPRAIPSYWRELWLERVDQPGAEPEDNDYASGNLAPALHGEGRQTCSDPRESDLQSVGSRINLDMISSSIGV